MITSMASVVERAADLGITYFDTARIYQNGNNEAHVGAPSRRAQGHRPLHQVRSQDQGGSPRPARYQPQGTRHRLRGYWYLHSKTKPEEVTDGLIEAQQIAKKAGKIRFAASAPTRAEGN